MFQYGCRGYFKIHFLSELKFVCLRAVSETNIPTPTKGKRRTVWGANFLTKGSDIGVNSTRETETRAVSVV